MSFRDEEGIYHPANEDEIIALVCRAYHEGLQIRVRGSTHSVAHAIYTDPLDQVPNKVVARGIRDVSNINLDLDRYASYRVVSEREREVEVDAGMRLGDWVDEETGMCTLGLLHSLSACQGWMLAGTGGIAHQTIAGFTATASAGGSLTYSVNDSICGFRLIDGTGEPRDVNEGDPEFPAMVPHLGLLGIVSKVRLRCEKNFVVEGRQDTSSPADADVDLCRSIAGSSRSLTEFLTNTEYARVEWWPQRGAERVVIWKATRCTRPDDFKPDRFLLFGNNRPQLAQLVIGSTYTVLGNLADLGRMGEQLRAILEHVGDDKELFDELLDVLRGLNPGGELVAFFVERALWRELDEAVEANRQAAAELSVLLPWFFPKLLDWFVPVDSEKKPHQEFADHAWRGLPMDNVVDDVYVPAEFTEIWVPLDRTEDVMQLLHKHFGIGDDGDDIDAGTAYERTGTFAIELYATKRNDFWLNPAYSDGSDAWKAGAFRVNPFWYGRNAEDPVAEFFPRLWGLLDEQDIPYRLHWGKFLPHADKKWVEHIDHQYPCLPAFLELRKKRDPEGIFLTKYWREHLGVDR